MATFYQPKFRYTNCMQMDAFQKRPFLIIYTLALLFLAGCQAVSQQTAVLPTASPKPSSLTTASPIPAELTRPIPTMPPTITPPAPPTESMQNSAVYTPLPEADNTTIPLPTVPPAATNVRSNEDTAYNYQQWARFDAIYPIYEPQFGTADSVNLRDDELVMGVTLGGEAKAYPVTTMQFREMVNDELAGIPILVTW